MALPASRRYATYDAGRARELIDDQLREARTVNTHGVHAKPMKVSRVLPKWRWPRRAAQLAAAGAVNLRDLATIPMSTANRYTVTWPSVHSSHEEHADGFSSCPVCRYTGSLQRQRLCLQLLRVAFQSSRTRLRTRSPAKRWARRRCPRTQPCSRPWPARSRPGLRRQDQEVVDTART
jgi:hypothetical protein